MSDGIRREREKKNERERERERDCSIGANQPKRVTGRAT
jgi:hypothetical protein